MPRIRVKNMGMVTMTSPMTITPVHSAGGYRDPACQTVKAPEPHAEGQLIATFNSSGVPIYEGARLTLVRQCGAVVEPARFAVDEDCARFFRVISLRLGYESLFHSVEPEGVGASLFPPLPEGEGDVRAPWRNLARKIGQPGMQFTVEVLCLWNVAPDSHPFTAAIYGRVRP